MNAKNFFVEVVSCKTGTVVERMGPLPEWKARKVDDGLNRNLNHATYFTRVIDAPKEKKSGKQPN